jgi:hypothetical protein
VCVCVCEVSSSLMCVPNTVYHDVFETAQHYLLRSSGNSYAWAQVRSLPLMHVHAFSSVRLLCMHLLHNWLEFSFDGVLVLSSRIFRVGQNRIYTPYMTVLLVISPPKIPYVHRIYIWFWPTLRIFCEATLPIKCSYLGPIKVQLCRPN